MPSRAWLALACAGIAALLYANTLHHGYALDDYPTIYGNRLTMAGVRGIPTLLHTAYWYGLDGLNDWLYRPLSLVTFALEWQVAPHAPALGHAVNVALYALTGFVLFRLLCSLFRDADPRVPLAIALLWIAHPTHTEVVANIKSRDELLAFLFSLLTLHASVRFALEPRRRHLLLVALWYALALLSKESPIVLVAVIPMTLYVFTTASTRRLAGVMAPIAVVTACYLVVRGTVLTSLAGSGPIALIDNSLVAAPDRSHRLATAFYVGAQYVRLLFFPLVLSSDYSYPQVPIVGFDNPVALGSLVVHVALLAWGSMRLWRRDAVGYGILFYLLGMALVANVLFLTHSTMADRFLYAPSLGVVMAVIVVLHRALGRIAFAGVVMALVLAAAARTWTRNPDWRNDTTIFAADARHAPNSARVHFLRGNHLVQELKAGHIPPDAAQVVYATALAEFRRAIALYPAYPEPHMGIGDAYLAAQDYTAAVAWYRELTRRNPRFAVGYYFLGVAFDGLGAHDSAAVYRARAVALDPTLLK
ncbi:MAG: tetratricopeptide repeat protein [bacterium]